MQCVFPRNPDHDDTQVYDSAGAASLFGKAEACAAPVAKGFVDLSMPSSMGEDNNQVQDEGTDPVERASAVDPDSMCPCPANQESTVPEDEPCKADGSGVDNCDGNVKKDEPSAADGAPQCTEPSSANASFSVLQFQVWDSEPSCLLHAYTFCGPVQGQHCRAGGWRGGG